MHNAHPLRIFWFSGLLTLLLAAVVGYYDGLVGLWIFAILVVLEVTLSFDNAVVNSKVLATMSRFWQTLFLTVGIFIAVFVVRFLLPIFIVQIAGGLGFMEVVNLALNDADAYGEVLYEAAPMIDAFGGAFLLMVALSYFLDRDKEVHWLKKIEPTLAKAGQFDNMRVALMLTLAAVLYFTVGDKYQEVVLVSAVLGILLHLALGLLASFFVKHEQHDEEARKKAGNIKVKTGMAAFASFMYLEVLDASFSFDGVIGAFAITSSILLIIAGLGVGAIWVRSMTVYLLRAGTLAKYRYLEHGAHWAILALGSVMMVKIYGVHLPEWLIGGLGLVFVVTAVISSIIEKRRMDSRAIAKKA
ncbi:MAG: hypothetical protein UY35_C0008G0008 [Candidatus Saccharibacteria bacterium GW2011_GWC2_48_9]|nr:MAG: hypothetical protein UY35_C0008G0008 [Candidatus Saccharibacteria bacterium GW2011_GWC2_48_9]HCH34305.1 DUF475 domain-containing protein [Candidatus Saccharibacteria bacterium]